MKHMFTTLSRYLGYPEERAFNLYLPRGASEFLEIVEEIRDVEKELENIPINKKDPVNQVIRLLGFSLL
jgi:hypothetical protein